MESLIEATGITTTHLHCVEVEPASEREISAFHTREFVQALKRANKLEAESLEEVGLVDDCPAFEGLLELACLEAGGSLQAADICESTLPITLR